MALLHYANLDDIHRPDVVMGQVSWGLQDFYHYLDTSKKYLESDAAVLRLGWKASDFCLTSLDKKADDHFFQSTQVYECSSEKDNNFNEGNVIAIIAADKNTRQLWLERKPTKPFLKINGKEKVFTNWKTTEAKEVWVELNEPVDRPNEPESTFRRFFEDGVKSLYQADLPESENLIRHRWRFDGELSVRDSKPERNQLLLSATPDKAMLLLKPNTYAIQKQLDAIHKLQNSPENNQRSLLRLFEGAQYAKWQSFNQNRGDLDWKLLTNESRPGTKEQREFVQIALATPDFAFLEGPPGSGKTTAICELILQLIAEDKRVLLCASTHVAVDNVIERLMDESNLYRNQVIPVRIGDKNNLSESVKPYQYDQFKNTEKQRLIKFLSHQAMVSQKHLLDALQGKDDSVIQRLILDSANLVCGTTIGILQHPDIQNTAQATPVFDVMIIDEASKTLFPEFLVPALLAKRWILVGDPKQLSPYVDDEAMAENINGCLPDKPWREACLAVYQAKYLSDQGAFVVVAENHAEKQAYLEQAEKHKSSVLCVDADGGNLDHLPYASIVVGKSENIAIKQNLLPLDVGEIRGNFQGLDISQRRIAARTKNKPSEENKTWGSEVSWRLARQYEQRLSQSSQSQRLQDQVEVLLPANDDLVKGGVKKKIQQVRRVALPSVLESLQQGFERTENQKNGTALSDGLPESVLKPRHVLLEYQHRMHPDISRFSREYIYQGKALQDPDDMKEKRAWSYSLYKERSLWLDVKKDGYHDKTNSHKREANVIIEEIQKFAAWSKSNLKTDTQDGHWTIAVLSFYRGQEKELRQQLRKLTKHFSAYRNFRLGNCKIELCTVDRFQGHEADVVFLSFVKQHATMFLASPNRLNVAVTRARYQLVLVGNRQALNNERHLELKQLIASVPYGNTWEK
ncbi:MAG: AAA domain-containing protein [Methylococcales bacterium]|nr:AAA domain-containing protein [Methylococcales bacterium]